MIVKYLGWKLETERTDKLRKAGHMYLLRGSILVLKGGRWSKWKKNRSKKNAINGGCRFALSVEKNLPVTKLIMCIWNELGANVCIIAATAVLS